MKTDTTKSEEIKPLTDTASTPTPCSANISSRSLSCENILHVMNTQWTSKFSGSIRLDLIIAFPDKYTPQNLQTSTVLRTLRQMGKRGLVFINHKGIYNSQIEWHVNKQNKELFSHRKN